MNDLSKPAQNPTERIEGSKANSNAKKPNLLDVDSDSDDDFMKSRQGTMGPNKPDTKKFFGGDSDSDDDDFKVGKKPTGQLGHTQNQAPAQPKPQNKLLMDSDDDDSDDGFKPKKKPDEVPKAPIAQPVSEKPKPVA